MDGQEWLESFERRIATARQRTGQVQAQLATVTGAATSRDGAVTATVDVACVVASLVLAPRAEDLTRAQLAEVIVATIREAQDAVARRAAEVAEPLLGTGGSLRERAR